MEIILNILKEDIMSSEYVDYQDCAIAIAAIRTGKTFSDLAYKGNYKNLDLKVKKMYFHKRLEKGEDIETLKYKLGVRVPIPPEDFTFILKTE